MSEKRNTATSKLFVFFYNVINAFLKSPTLRHQGFAQVQVNRYIGIIILARVRFPK